MCTSHTYAFISDALQSVSGTPSSPSYELPARAYEVASRRDWDVRSPNYYEVGSPKDWPKEWGATSGSLPLGLIPDTTLVRNLQQSGGGGSSSVLSTTTGPASSTTSPATSNGGASGKQSCPICIDDDIPAAKWIRFNCGHGVCSDCHVGLDANDYKCPICKAPFKKAQGIQPKDGSMNVREDPNLRIPGFEKDHYCRGAIVISYNFPSAKQGVNLSNAPLMD